MNDLIFFDINGTLIKRDERTDIPYSNAVNALLGVSRAMEGVDTSARSDRDVLIEVLERHGQKYSPKKWDEFMELYAEELTVFAKTDVWRASADAVPFVRALRSRGWPMALITGELSLGARCKLEKIGLWNCFLTGGYGEDGLKRFDIADTALRRAREITGREFDTLYVIGDTVLDIETAAHLGAVSIAVTTGSHSRERLLASNPDHCVDRFSELENLFLP